MKPSLTRCGLTKARMLKANHCPLLRRCKQNKQEFVSSNITESSVLNCSSTKSCIIFFCFSLLSACAKKKEKDLHAQSCIDNMQHSHTCCNNIRFTTFEIVILTTGLEGGMVGWPGWGAYLHLQRRPPSGSTFLLPHSTSRHLRSIFSNKSPPPTPPQDITGAQPSMTVQQGKHTTVLEMEFCVLDFCLVTDSVYRSDYADPESVLVLLTNDLVRRNGSPA